MQYITACIEFMCMYDFVPIFTSDNHEYTTSNWCDNCVAFMQYFAEYSV